MGLGIAAQGSPRPRRDADDTQSVSVSAGPSAPAVPALCGGPGTAATYAPDAPTPPQRRVRKGKRPHEVEAIRFDPDGPAWCECTCGFRLDARSAAQLEDAYRLHTAGKRTDDD